MSILRSAPHGTTTPEDGKVVRWVSEHIMLQLATIAKIVHMSQTEYAVEHSSRNLAL